MSLDTLIFLEHSSPSLNTWEIKESWSVVLAGPIARPPHSPVNSYSAELDQWASGAVPLGNTCLAYPTYPHPWRWADMFELESRVRLVVILPINPSLYKWRGYLFPQKCSKSSTSSPRVPWITSLCLLITNLVAWNKLYLFPDNSGGQISDIVSLGWDQEVFKAVLLPAATGGAVSCLFPLLVAPGTAWLVATVLWAVPPRSLCLFLCVCVFVNAPSAFLLWGYRSTWIVKVNLSISILT